MANKLYQLGQEACLKCQIQLSLIKMWVKQITKAIQSTVVPVDICYRLHQLEPLCPTKQKIKKLKGPANGKLIIGFLL